MKAKVWFYVLGFCVLSYCWAKDVVDVFGTNSGSATKILSEYAQQVEAIEHDLQVEMQKIGHSNGGKEQKSQQDLIYKKLMEREALKEKIKKQYGYLSVDIQSIFYPQDKSTYSTIEVVQKEQPERMHFVEPRHYASKNTSKIKHDLIQQMLEFEQKTLHIIFTQELKKSSCPVFHCILSFEYPELKPYLFVFNQGVIKDKKLILETLKNDPEPERRQAAILLLGHLKNPREILNIASGYVQDKDAGVRNNAMRVMSTTMDKAKIYDVALEPVMSMLDAPNVTDRNKALFVVLEATKSQANHKKIMQHSGEQLIRLLELKQLNNHDTAYLILKSLSHQDFGARNYVAWRNWVKNYNLA